MCLAGPAASFALTAAANALGAYRLAGASVLLGAFNLLPMPPLDGGMALSHLAEGRFAAVRQGISLLTMFCLLAAGMRLWQLGGGMWLLLTGALISTQTVKNLAKATAMV